MDNNNIDNIFNLQIEGEAQQHLKVAATWARIVAIVGFISLGLSVVSAIRTGSKYGAPAGISSLVGVVVVGIIYVVLYLFLLRFARHTTKSIEATNQTEFNAGVNGLRSYFKMVGILLIICLSLFVLLILAQIAGTAFLRR